MSECLRAKRKKSGPPDGSAKPGLWYISRQRPPRIVWDKSAPEPVHFAAGELAKYLRRILGGGAKNTRAEKRPRLVLERVADDELGDEGFELSFKGHTLRIRGDSAGIVYGAYEFLRRHCGCQFSGLGPDGETVPRRARIAVPESCARMKPKLWYRGYQFFYQENLPLTLQRIGWMAKNGLNYVMFTPRPEAPGEKLAPAVDPGTSKPVTETAYTLQWFQANLQPEILKRGLKLDMNHHNLLYWLPPGRYFDRHPEWYALLDGRRVAIHRQLAVCTSNPDAVAALTENVLAFLRRNPLVKIVGVIPEDGEGMCQCDRCVAQDLDPKDAFRSGESHKSPEGENQSKSRRYALLVNHVARAVKREFPHVLVGYAAYVDLQWPPPGIRLESNVLVWVAIYWRDGANPLTWDSNSPSNRFFCDILKHWRQAHAGPLILYEYYMGMNAQVSLPYPMAELICREWPFLKELGIEGATIQSWTTCHNSYGLNNLAFARSGWEDRVDYERLLDDYLEGMFGSIADDVRPIYVRMQQALAKVEKHGIGDSPFLPLFYSDGSTSDKDTFLPNGQNIGYLLDELGVGFIHQTLRRALRKARDAREKRQARNLIRIAKYWEMAADFFRVIIKSNQARKAGNQEAVAGFMNEAQHVLERMTAYLAKLPDYGWICVTVIPKWHSRLRGFRRRAGAQN